MTETTFTLRLDAALKTEFATALKASDLNGAQVLRSFMRDFVHQQKRAAAEHDAWFRNQVHEGLASANAGNLIPSDEVEAHFTARRAASKKNRES